MNSVAPAEVFGGVEKAGDAPWVVQKFGGTSIGKFAINIVEDILKPSLENHKVAVVCSARSSHTKEEGTTNRLLRAAQQAASKLYRGSYKNLVTTILDDHIQAATQNIRSATILEKYVNTATKECADLSKFLEAIQTLGEISVTSEDYVISKGEILSGLFIAALLEDHGIESQFVNLSEVVPATVTETDQASYDAIAKAMAERALACEDRVPVITGYFGSVHGGLLDTIDRGYTDLCAALVAVGLNATELQVWKEVDGIYTADPRKVPTAQLIAMITPAEASELTYFGSEVIHPFTMEQCVRKQIPIRVKNVMKPRGNGTVIFGGRDPYAAGRPYHKRNSSAYSVIQRQQRPTAVTVKDRMTVLNIYSNKKALSHGFLAKIFATLDKWRLSVDLISTSEVNVSMALHSKSASRSGGGESEAALYDSDLDGAVRDLEEFGEVDRKGGMAIICLVGREMRNMIGIAGKMFSTLGDHDVNIEMISQGASEINISCVIDEWDADRALSILHTNLFTFLE